MPYQLFIGLRYLKAKRKQTFISVITFISIIGIMVGVTALIVVLSVMNGFEETLKEKILGLNAHVVVVGFGDGIGDYDTLSETVRTIEGVKGASPFTYSQAMLSGGKGFNRSRYPGARPGYCGRRNRTAGADNRRLNGRNQDRLRGRTKNG